MVVLLLKIDGVCTYIRAYVSVETCHAILVSFVFFLFVSGDGDIQMFMNCGH